MKNLKFGVFSLGLLAAIVATVSSMSAQPRVPFDFAEARQVEPRMRTERPNVMALEGRGSQLGVMVSDVDVKAAASGVKIDEVNDDSPAEKAGIKAGDVVVDYDGERVRSARQFTRLVQETPEGRTVPIGILRDGKKQTLNATPESGRMTWNFGPEVDRALREAERGTRGFRFDVPAPNFDFHFDGRGRGGREPRRFEYRLPNDLMPFMGRSRGRLGVTVQSLTPELEEYFGTKNGGVLVSSVTKESAAAKAGIKAGDVIVSINGRSVDDSDDLIQELEDLDGEVTIVVVRDRKEMTLKATLERPRATTPRAGSRPRMVL
jgi:membrane-associated protease RseP (regulator of RpoE activity)